MRLTYSVARRPTNISWREVHVSIRPFSKEGVSESIPHAAIVSYLYRGPWACAPEGSIDLGGLVFTSPAAGRISSFVCPSCQDQSYSHRVGGFQVVGFTKNEPSEYVFYVEASRPIVQVQEKLQLLARSILERAGDWLSGGWVIQPIAASARVPSSGKQKESGLGRRIRS